MKGKLKKLAEEVEQETRHRVYLSIDSRIDVAAEISFDEERDAWNLTLKNRRVPQALIAHELCHLFQFTDPKWDRTRITITGSGGPRYSFLRDWLQSLLWDPWVDYEALRRGFDICGYAHPYFRAYIDSLQEYQTNVERYCSQSEIFKLAIDYTYKALDNRLCGFNNEWRECEQEFQRVAPGARRIGSEIADAMLAHDVHAPEGVAAAFYEILAIMDESLPELEAGRHLRMPRGMIAPTPLPKKKTRSTLESSRTRVR